MTTGSPRGAPPAFEWTRTELGVSRLLAVIHDGSRFLAAGAVRQNARAGSILASKDGIDWQSISSDTFDGDDPYSISRVGDRYVVLASARTGPESVLVHVWTSRDLERWTRWSSADTNRWPVSFARIAPRWLMSSMNGEIVRSDDRHTWEPAAGLRNAQPTRFVSGPSGTFVAGTKESENTTAHEVIGLLTRDGADWLSLTVSEGGSIVSRIGGNDHGYVVFGQSIHRRSKFTGAAWWSHDGREWSEAGVPAEFSDGEWWVDQVEPFQAGFVAAAQPPIEGPPRIMWSPDGREWSFLHSGPDVPLGSTSLVISDGQLFVFGEEDARNPAIRIVWSARVNG